MEELRNELSRFSDPDTKLVIKCIDEHRKDIFEIRDKNPQMSKEELKKIISDKFHISIMSSAQLLMFASQLEREGRQPYNVEKYRNLATYILASIADIKMLMGIS